MDPFDTASFPACLKAAFKAARRAPGPTFLGLPFRYLEEVASTNDLAREWADAMERPAPDGAMVVAGAQTAGRGRTGPWVSAPGAGLWFSLVLRPGLGYPGAGMLPLAVGSGVVLALRRLGVDARLKWPNDVVVGRAKLAGILVEGRTVAGRLSLAVAGVGVNWVSPGPALFPGRPHYRTAALGEELARASQPARPAGASSIAPAEALLAILRGIEQAYLVLRAAGPEPFTRVWPVLSAHFCRPVEVWPSGADAPHEALGGELRPDGSLEVLIPGGGRERLTAAEVSLGLPALS